jgi:hypothetical protein
LVLFLALIFVALSPVIIFVVLPVIQRIYRKRLEAAACAFACLSCGGLLGLSRSALLMRRRANMSAICSQSTTASAWCGMSTPSTPRATFVTC